MLYTGTVSTRVQESREQTAQRHRDAARRALRDRVQSAFDGALEDVDMRRLQDVLLQMGRPSHPRARKSAPSGTYDFNKNSLCSYAFNIRIFSC